jgi:hypothetical protein
MRLIQVTVDRIGLDQNADQAVVFLYGYGRLKQLLLHFRSKELNLRGH